MQNNHLQIFFHGLLFYLVAFRVESLSSTYSPKNYLESMFSLKGKVAIVTGSTRGIGKGIAEALFQSGASVVVNSRHEEDTIKTLEDFKQRFGKSDRILGVPADVSSIDGAYHLVDTAVNHFGSLDVLFNNAGINIPPASFERNTVGDWENVADANLRGPIHMATASLPHLRKSPAGRIINLASRGSHVAMPYNTYYTITKGGILLFTKSLAAELAGSTVTVNSISPGVFDTAMNRKLGVTDDNETILCQIPKGRLGKVDDLLSTVILLASNSSSYMTGTDILVDGCYSFV